MVERAIRISSNPKANIPGCGYLTFLAIGHLPPDEIDIRGLQPLPFSQSADIVGRQSLLGLGLITAQGKDSEGRTKWVSTVSDADEAGAILDYREAEALARSGAPPPPAPTRKRTADADPQPEDAFDDIDFTDDAPFTEAGPSSSSQHPLTLQSVMTYLTTRFDSLETRFDRRFDQIDERLISHDARFTTLEATVRSLQSSVPYVPTSAAPSSSAGPSAVAPDPSFFQSPEDFSPFDS